jgi:hypothetical protein
MCTNFTYPYRRVRLLFMLCCFTLLSYLTNAQTDGTQSGGPKQGGTWEIFPMHNQLYSRNISNDTAFVRVKGFYDAGLTNAKLVVTQDADNNGAYDSEPASNSTTYQIIDDAGDVRNFDLNIPIRAGLFSYRFRLWSGNNHVVTSINIVAGDAYYIQGQSNAEARPVVGSGDVGVANSQADAQGAIPGPISTDQNIGTGARRFIRVYGGGSLSSPTWRYGDADKDYNSEFNLGQFGMRIGERIVREKGIPVCIMNGAELGFPIQYFLKDATKEDRSGHQNENTNNYIRELARLTKAGLIGQIRAIIWFQGESNTYTGAGNYKTFEPYGAKLTKVEYKAAFNNLYTSWLQDIGPVANYYIIQIRPGCFTASADDVMAIQEAQRELDAENPKMDIISTNDFPHYTDNCHYRYITGYKLIGDRVYNLLDRDFYGGDPSDGMLTPKPSNRPGEGPKFSFSENGNPLQLTLYFQHPESNFTITDNVADKFTLLGGTYPISSVNIENLGTSAAPNNVLRINFTRGAGSPPQPIGLRFESDKIVTGTSGFIKNSTGISLIDFEILDVPFISLPIDPLKLRVSNNNSTNVLNWEADNNPMFESFSVQRSFTGNDYTDLYELKGTLYDGTGRYNYTDIKPNATRNYYRIKATRVDGSVVFSQEVGVNNRFVSAIGISVYPNPVTDRANVSVTLKKSSNATVQIFDGSGKLISTRKLALQKGNNMFSAGEILDHGSGIYLVRVLTDEEVYNARVVRVK